MTHFSLHCTEVIVEFTQNTFTGSEDSQSATVSLRLAAGSAVVPTGGLTVSLTAIPDNASGYIKVLLLHAL